MTNDAILYLRFSPRPNAAECESLENQEAQLRPYCQMKSLNIAQIIRDPEVSARKVPLAMREGGMEMIRLLDIGVANNLVATHVDRLFRDQEDGEHWSKVWKKKGVRLHLAAEGSYIDTSTPLGALMFTFLLGIAAFSANTSAEKTKVGLRRRQSENRRVSRYARYGWQFSGDKKIEVPNPVEGAILARIACERLAGLGFSKIAKGLKKDGLFRRNGEPWCSHSVSRVLQRSQQSV